MISKIAFFKGYKEGVVATHSKLNGKKHSLCKELYWLRHHIRIENAKDGKRLYNIAVEIYLARHKKQSLCATIIAVIQNALAGRGFITESKLFKDIEKLGHKKKLDLYEWSHEPLGQPKNKLVPRKLF